VIADLRDQLQTTLGAAYSLERELSGAGMSRVFVAEDNALGRRVVVKVLPPELAAEVSAERFRREIQLAARLQHPMIVPLLSAGAADGLLYYTMPFVEGESLSAKLALEGALPIAESVHILRDVAEALACAHRQGVVHRDIKPANILLAEDHALVTDFGVAKALSAATDADGGTLTSVGVALGTPTYMAPEQAVADPTTDHRADLYALGCVAYELLAGTPPFAARTTQQLIVAHLTESPEPISNRRPDVPSALAALVMRLLEKSAAARPQAADEVLRELDAIATGSSRATEARRALRLKRRSVATAAATLAVAGAAIGANLVARRHAAASALDTKRVAVGVFENRTGDPRLDPIGSMAADWITRGIAETGLLDVVDVETQVASLAALPGSARADGAATPRPSALALARQAGARTLIAGSYYLQGDSLQFESRVIDAASSKRLQTVPPVRAPAAAPLVGVDLLRRRVMGTLATLFDPAFTTHEEMAGRPPTYEAYQEFIEASRAKDIRDGKEAVRHYDRAYELDSTFVLAAVTAAGYYFYLGRCDRTDAIARTLNRSPARLAPFDRAMLDRQVAKCHGDWPEAYRAALRLLEASPRSLEARVLAAKGALENNRPREALALLRPIDPARSPLRAWVTDYYDMWTTALYVLGDYSQELAVAERWAREDPSDGMIGSLQALAALGRGREVEQRLGELLAMPNISVHNKEFLTVGFAQELHTRGDVESARRVAQRLVDWMSARPSGEAAGEAHRSYLARALYGLGQLDTARRVFAQLAMEHPDSVSYIGFLGTIAARLGDHAEAERISGQLAALRGPYLNGQPSLYRARIAALLGDRAEATALVRQALNEGVAPGGYELFPDMDFEPLRGYAPFEELMRPKG
jgi:eukaryotic-like serine/threonine-protein kinase